MLNRLRLRLRALLHTAEMERELDEELRFHLEKEAEQNMARGMSPNEARLAALRSFGGVEQVKEESRDSRGVRFLEELRQDLRYGARRLVKNPGFTVVAVITLALGIGANTAIFSVVNTVLLQPLPYKDSDRLMMVWEENTRQGFPRNSLSAANYIDWRDQNQVFEGTAVLAHQSFNLTGAGEPERIDGRRVSTSLFGVLGVEPQLGRAFLPEEDQAGSNRVVIISHGLWQRRFGSDTSIIGKPLALNGESYTVVGVMPPHFQFPSREVDMWVPIAFNAREAANRGRHYLESVARLKPGITLEQARADMNDIATKLQQQYPDTNTGIGAVVIPLHEQVVGDIKPALLVLLGAVGLVLLIACVNVANLLLARAAAREKEIAIRLALGGRRFRLVRQFMTESVLMAAIGGVVGLLLAMSGVNLLRAFIPENISQVKAVTIDARVLGFTLLASLLTGIIFGLVPATHASKFDLNEPLKEGGRDSSAGSRGNRIRGLLVIAEVAVSLVILIGAGLLIKSFVRLNKVDPGFQAKNLLTMQVVLPQSKYSEPRVRSAFYTELLKRIESLPGVESAAVTNYVPLLMQGDTVGITIEGRPDPGPGQVLDVVTRVISLHYFNALGIEVLQGREFTEQDKANDVVIINETMARRLWPAEDPIGKRIKVGSFNTSNPWMTIIGMVKDVRQFELTAEPRLQMYLPYEQIPSFPPYHLAVRTNVEPLSVATAVRRTVWDIDKDQPVSNIRTMENVVSESVSRQRFSTLLLGLFAAVALVLAAVGIYGVISYSVAQRTREIGIRMALGAQSRDVLKQVIGQGVKLALAGVVVGMIGAFALTRLMRSLLFGVSVTDPLTFVGLSLLLIVVALVACWIPAQRATKVDPLLALRYE